MKRSCGISEQTLNESRVLNIKSVLKKFLLSSSGVLIPVNLIFLFVPVLRYFSYETAVLNGVLITLLSGLLYFKHSSEDGGLAAFIKQVSLCLLVPPVLYLISNLFRGDCSFISGLKYYFLFTVTAPVVGAGIAALVLLTGLKYKKSIFLIIFILLLFNWVIDFYLYPQFYLYNSIFTFYPRVIYDEFIPVTEKMIFYRLGIVAVSLALLILERKMREEAIMKRFWWGTGIMIVVPALSWSVSSSAGLITMKNEMTREFRDSIITAHFFILSEDKLSPTERYLVAVSHEIYYNQLAELYGVEPKRTLESIIFKDNASKKRHLGVENADVAKPWQGVAFTTRGNLENTLKHELAHLFTAEFGWGPFKVAAWFDPGLIEGSATAGDGFISGYDIDEFMSAVQNSKYKVDPLDIFPGFSFFDVNPSLAYALSGSLSRFLIEKYGKVKYREYHATGDAETVYGKPVEDLLAGWAKETEGVQSDITPEILDFFLERQPLTRKTCPRYYAEMMTEAAKLISVKKYHEAAEVYGRIMNSNDSFDAFSGRTASLVLAGDVNEAIAGLRPYSVDGRSYSIRARYQLLLFRVATLAGDTALAKEADQWLSNGKQPAFITAGHSFAALLLKHGQSPFLYNTMPPDERLRLASRLAEETGDTSAFEEAVDLAYRLVLPFSPSPGLKRYINGLTPSGKLKLCTVMARANEPAAVTEILATLDQKTLPFARERLKYRIFKAVFEK